MYSKTQLYIGGVYASLSGGPSDPRASVLKILFKLIVVSILLLVFYAIKKNAKTDVRIGVNNFETDCNQTMH